MSGVFAINSGATGLTTQGVSVWATRNPTASTARLSLGMFLISRGHGLVAGDGENGRSPYPIQTPHGDG